MQSARLQPGFSTAIQQLGLKSRAVTRPGQSQDDSVLMSTCRTGRETARLSPCPRQASSLPRPAHPSTPPPPETQRPVTPLVLQRDQSHHSLQHQQTLDNRLGKTWTRSQFVSKLRQIATAKNTNENPAGLASTRPSQCVTPVQNLNTNKNSLVTHQTPTTNSQESDDRKNVRKNIIRTFSPSKGLMTVVSGETHPRCLTPTAKEPLTDHSVQITPALGHERSLQRCSSQGDRKQHLDLPLHPAQRSPINVSKSSLQVSGLQPSGTDVDSKSRERRVENRYLFTPPPISPAQEAVLYRSLEEEILSNLQQLGMDSDASDSENDQSSPHPETPGNSPEISYEIQKPSVPVSFSNPKEMKKARPEVNDYEISNGNKLFEETSLENWVNPVPGGFRDRMQESTSNSDSRHLNVSKPSEAGSWSSLGSSLDSKDSVEPSKTSEAKNIVEADLTTNNSSSTVTCKHEKLRVSSFRQRRSLKKPERVPSIYKLKLRSFVRPRRDHRPDKKPSKIPKPVSYRGSQGSGDAAQRSEDSTALCRSLKGHDPSRRASTTKSPTRNPQTSKSSPTAERCQTTDQEMTTDQDLETWV